MDGKQGIRALLGSLKQILWPEAEWNYTVSSLLEANSVKKCYRRACLIVHPDRTQGKEYEALARLIFDELSTAYNKWCDDGMPSLYEN